MLYPVTIENVKLPRTVARIAGLVAWMVLIVSLAAPVTAEPPAAETSQWIVVGVPTASSTTGTLTAFLQPYCAPGWIVSLTDDRFPEHNGQYLVESTRVTFGTQGARRYVGLGPKLGFTI